MFPKWWHSSHYFYAWASTEDLDTACIGQRPKSCEVPCIRRPWLAIDSQQSFDFSPSTGHCIAILPSDLPAWKKPLTAGRDYGKIQWTNRLQTVHATKGRQIGIEILFFERVRNRVHVCLELVHRMSAHVTTSKTTAAYAATHHPPNIPAQGKVVLDLLKGLEHKGHCICMDNWFNSPALVLQVVTA